MTGDYLSPQAFWLVLALFAVATAAVAAARSWHRQVQAMCAGGGHRWVRGKHGRSCVDCWEQETDQ